MKSEERKIKDRAYAKAYRLADLARAARHLREWRRANPDKAREQNRRQRGLPAPTRPCPSACEVCGAQPEKKALCLDHEHLTNTFRGWLCHRCNRLLGFAKDSPVLLRALAAYLERSL